MFMLIFWIAFAVVLCAICSVLETVLLSIRTPELVAMSKRDARGATQLLEIKRNKVGDAISAILIVNTIASTVGPGFAGASAARIWGDTAVGVVSAVLTLLILFVAEIAPKTYAATHAKAFAGITGRTLAISLRLLAPALVLTRALTRWLAADQTGGLTRKQLAAIVSSASSDGSISSGESELLANMIYIRTVMLETVNTPFELVFSMAESASLGELADSEKADAFSRIPLRGNDPHSLSGFVEHRRVLKALAKGRSRDEPLSSFREALPALKAGTNVLTATRQLLDAHQSIALVMNESGEAVGIVTVEDLLEAILGIDITDESDDIADLRRSANDARRERTQRIRQGRRQWADADEGENAQD